MLNFFYFSLFEFSLVKKSLKENNDNSYSKCIKINVFVLSEWNVIFFVFISMGDFKECINELQK